MEFLKNLIKFLNKKKKYLVMYTIVEIILLYCLGNSLVNFLQFDNLLFQKPVDYYDGKTDFDSAEDFLIRVTEDLLIITKVTGIKIKLAFYHVVIFINNKFLFIITILKFIFVSFLFLTNDIIDNFISLNVTNLWVLIFYGLFIINIFFIIFLSNFMIILFMFVINCLIIAMICISLSLEFISLSLIIIYIGAICILILFQAKLIKKTIIQTYNYNNFFGIYFFIPVFYLLSIIFCIILFCIFINIFEINLVCLECTNIFHNKCICKDIFNNPNFSVDTKEFYCIKHCDIHKHIYYELENFSHHLTSETLRFLYIDKISFSDSLNEGMDYMDNFLKSNNNLNSNNIINQWVWLKSYYNSFNDLLYDLSLFLFNIDNLFYLVLGGLILIIAMIGAIILLLV